MVLVYRENDEATTRLLTDFAQALCCESEVRLRFAQVMLPQLEIEINLEDTFYSLANEALKLNRDLLNPKARGTAPTRTEFASQGRANGVQPDFCKKMYDLIKASPLNS